MDILIIPELIHNILLNLDCIDIISFHLVNKTLNDDDIWTLLVNRDYPFIHQSAANKKIYIDYYQFFDAYTYEILVAFLMYKTKYINLNVTYSKINDMLVDIVCECPPINKKYNQNEIMDYIYLIFDVITVKIKPIVINFDELLIYKKNSDTAKIIKLKTIIYDMLDRIYDD